MDEPTSRHCRAETARMITTDRSLPRTFSILMISTHMKVVFSVRPITVLYYGEVLWPPARRSDIQANERGARKSSGGWH